jgi:hypothetical protein
MIFEVPDDQIDDYVWHCDCQVFEVVDNNWDLRCTWCGEEIETWWEYNRRILARWVKATVPL